MPTALNKTQSWSAVVNYVDTITGGVKDDDDPRFKRVEILAKEPADCFPKQIFDRWGFVVSVVTLIDNAHSRERERDLRKFTMKTDFSKQNM